MPVIHAFGCGETPNDARKMAAEIGEIVKKTDPELVEETIIICHPGTFAVRASKVNTEKEKPYFAIYDTREPGTQENIQKLDDILTDKFPGCGIEWGSVDWISFVGDGIRYKG